MPSVLFNLKQCFYFYVELFLFEDTFWSGFKDFSFTFTNGASGEEKLRGLLFFSLLRQKLRDNLMGPAEEAFSLLYLRFYSEFFELSQQPLTFTLGHL